MRGVPESADMHSLEQDRPPFSECVLPVFEALLHLDWSGLPDGNGRVRGIFGQAEGAFDAARLRLADENRDPLNFGIIVRFDDNLMIGSNQLELGIQGADHMPVAST